MSIIHSSFPDKNDGQFYLLDMEDENWTDGHDLLRQKKQQQQTIGVSKISERTYICSITMWGSLWHFDNLKNNKTSQIGIDRNWVCSHQSTKVDKTHH